MQESELALQRLAAGLGELTAMKSDLAQDGAADDSALLEQQLEQLHGQWEELCTKVSAGKPRARRTDRTAKGQGEMGRVSEERGTNASVMPWW